MGKRAALSDFAATKPGSEQPEIRTRSAGPSAEKKPDNRKGQTLRLSATAWRQLKTLAMDKESTVHQLLVDAVDDLFRKEGRPPIAMDEQPPRRKP